MFLMCRSAGLIIAVTTKRISREKEKESFCLAVVVTML